MASGSGEFLGDSMEAQTAVAAPTCHYLAWVSPVVLALDCALDFALGKVFEV